MNQILEKLVTLPAILPPWSYSILLLVAAISSFVVASTLLDWFSVGWKLGFRVFKSCFTFLRTRLHVD